MIALDLVFTNRGVTCSRYGGIRMDLSKRAVLSFSPFLVALRCIFAVPA